MYQKLNQPFIGLKLTQYDYERVNTVLPVPTLLTHTNANASMQKSLELIYIIDGYILSSKQYHWVASIKFAIEQRLGHKIEWIEEYYTNDVIACESIIYTLNDLSVFFTSTPLVYPNILYPLSSKVLYKYLCWAATKLYRKDILYTELLICIAIRFNNKLPVIEKLTRRELLNQSFVCIEFIRNEAPSTLKGKELKEAYSKGGKMRALQKNLEKQKVILKIEELLNEGNFFKKSNGKPHIGKLAEELNLARQTVSKYLKP